MTVTVTNLAYLRMSAPDLDGAERFLAAFGLVRSARTADSLFMRGTERAHHTVIVEQGAPAVHGIGFEVNDPLALGRATSIAGASALEAVNEPGGGRRVRVRDPLGLTVELVHGMESLEPIAVEPVAMNDARDRHRRLGAPKRVAKGPARVRNLSHVVITAPDVSTVGRWYADTLGLLCSDRVYKDALSNVVAAFYRLNRGDEYVDHHLVNIAGGPAAGFNHFAFEVLDIDDIMKGHEHLEALGYTHMRGPGRHVIGSQIFDYWLDPWGRMLEHMTDTDVLNCHAIAGDFASGTTESPWGTSNSAGFRNHISR